MRLLVVEDEAPLRDQLKQTLTESGYAVDAAKDGREGLFYAEEYPYDVAVIDIGLPHISGVELIANLRKQNINYPILILTARGDWQDKVEGLEAGADDYLVKPFYMEELQARLNALLRRSVGFSKPMLEAGPISLDTTAKQVLVDGNRVELTAYEFKVLEYLMLHAGETISKIRLTEHIYDQDFDRDSNVIEVFMRRLRKKLDPDNKLKPIETLRGHGYRFALDVQAAT